jgi:hypothetical protein
MGVKILQLNSQRSNSVASDIKNKTISDIDIIMLQEPYTYGGVIKGYSQIGTKIVQPRMNNPQVGIIVLNSAYDVIQLPPNDLEYIVGAQITTDSGSYFMISVYFRPSQDVDPIINQLEKMISDIGPNNRIIICSDANANSASWFSARTDTRGEKIQEFVLSNNLTIINKPSNAFTFSTVNGESNIDITLATLNATRNISDWRVSPTFTISDHNAILFNINDGGSNTNSRSLINDSPTYNIKKANWAKFEIDLKSKFKPHIKDLLVSLEPDDAVRLFTKFLKQVCDDNITKQRKVTKSVPWWNSELTSLRKRVITAKKELSKARKLRLIYILDECKKRYKNVRKIYVNTIRKNKIKCWHDFVEEIGNSNPWSFVYKLSRNKILTDNVFHAVEHNGQFTGTWIDTMKILISKLVPDDDINTNDNLQHTLDLLKITQI